MKAKVLMGIVIGCLTVALVGMLVSQRVQAESTTTRPWLEERDSSCWQLTGNASINPANNFLGTVDHQPLILKVNGEQAFRMESGGGFGFDGIQYRFSPNLTGGFSDNEVMFGVDGGTISGGGSNGWPNIVLGNYGTVSGGHGNTASGDSSTVSGGYINEASGGYATVPGGVFNTAQGWHSFAAGYRAKALQNGTFVWSDYTYGEDFTSTAANQFLIRASGGVGIGTTTPERKLHIFDDAVPQLRLEQNNGYIDFWGGNNLHIITQGNNHRFFISGGTGNVGIGTNTPENALHVNGAINLDPISTPATPTTGFVLYVDSGDGDLKAKASSGAVTTLAFD